MTKLKTYQIHNNGDRPFSVTVNDLNVTIFNNTSNKQIQNINADAVFIGKKSPNGDYNGLKSRDAIGNSILLKISNKYMYIGHIIYTFYPVKGDHIIKYYSNIGNSDVPYPYAIGKSHIYILLDKVATHRSYFDIKEDIYTQHYYNFHIKMCLFGNPKTDICANKAEYEPRIQEWKDKTIKLRTRRIDT